MTGGTPLWVFSIVLASLSSHYPLSGMNRPPESHTVGSFCSCIPQYIAPELYTRTGKNIFKHKLEKMHKKKQFPRRFIERYRLHLILKQFKFAPTNTLPKN